MHRRELFVITGAGVITSSVIGIGPFSIETEANTMTITACVRLTAKPGRREELLEIMTGAIAATRSDPLCSSVEIFKGIEGADDVLLVEQWPGVEDHHRFISAFMEAGGLTDILDLLATDIETLHYSPTGL